MKTKPLYYIAIIIFLILIDVVLLQSHKIKYNEALEINNQLSSEIINQREEIKSRSKLIQCFFQGAISRKHKKIINSNSKLKECLGSSSKVILFFEEGVCAACIEKISLDLEILAKSVGNDKIVVVTTWGKDGRPMTKEGSSFKHFLVKESLTSDFEINSPLVFVLNNDGDIDLLFVPEFYPDYQQTYFSKVLPEYFQAHKMTN